jgi:hypothetical protein
VGIVVAREPHPVRITILVTLVFLACAHSGEPTTKEEIAHRDLTKAKAFLTQIPGCSSEEGAVALADLNPDVAAPPRLRGFLVRDDGVCTQMKCNTECCNKCAGGWFLAASRSGQEPKLQLTPEMTWYAMDCSLASLKAGVRGIEVIVTGTIRPRDPNAPGVPTAGEVNEIAYSAICGAR